MLSSFGFILLGLILLAVGAVGGRFALLYLRFRATPEARWAAGVRCRAAELGRRAREAGQERTHVESAFRAESERLREQALERYCGSVSVEALADYPGIGPVTVSRLKEHGLVSLAHFRRPLTVAIPGLGPKRMDDVQKAAHALLRDSTSRFEAGACPEAQECARKQAALVSRAQPRIAAATERQHAAEHELTRFRPMLQIAEGVTFGRWRRREGYPGMTAELLATPLEQLLPPTPPPLPPTSAQPIAPPSPAPPSPPTERVPAKAAVAPPAPQPASVRDLFRTAMESASAAETTAAIQHPRLPHLRLTVEFGFAIARADGRIANSERDAIRSHLQAAFGHEPELLRFIHPLSEQFEKAPIDLDDCLGRARALFRPEELEQLYALGERVADAAGRRNKKEEEWLDRVRRKLGLPDVPPARPARAPLPPTASVPGGPIVAMPVGTLTAAAAAAPPASLGTALSPEECRAALEIAPETPLSADLVRRQFRLLRERFDPARFESHGREFIEVAARKLERVEAAARALLQGMGKPLEPEAAPEKPKDLRENPDLDAIFG